jgi:pimeloyl-ACP methyl ester carboxylesterase
MGFNASVFSDFVKRNRKNYTMYSVTIPGYGDTSAPAMPDSAQASYGLQYWTRGVIEGVRKLIDKEHLDKPFLVGHFTQGAQVVIRMAAEMPEIIGGVIVVGGPAKFISFVNGKIVEYPVEKAADYIDRITAPRWFGPITKEAFDKGNYPPELYSVDAKTGKDLWDVSAKVPLPVYIRYTCEFFSSDVTLYADKIKVPVLVLRAMFTPEILSRDANGYIKPQFIDAWERMAKANPKIVIEDVMNSATFIWKDHPVLFDKVIEEFMKRK